MLQSFAACQDQRAGCAMQDLSLPGQHSSMLRPPCSQADSQLLCPLHLHQGHWQGSG